MPSRTSRLWTLGTALAGLGAITLGFAGKAYFSPRGSSCATCPACSYYFEQSRLCASLQWLEGPALGISRMALHFHDVSDPLSPKIPDAEILVSLWMPGMGHGSDRPVITPSSPPQGAAGGYLVENVRFTMKGHWEVWVTLLRNNAFLEKAKIDIDLK